MVATHVSCTASVMNASLSCSPCAVLGEHPTSDATSLGFCGHGVSGKVHAWYVVSCSMVHVHKYS